VVTTTEIENIKNPMQLFTRLGYKKEFRELSKKYHPDMGGDGKVFAHIVSLYHKAESMDRAGAWGYAGTLSVIDESGIKYQLNYLSKHDFELGLIYVGDTDIAYKIDISIMSYKDAIKLPVFRYKSPEMQKQFDGIVTSKYKNIIKTKDAVYLVHSKRENAYLLCEILERNKIEKEHVAWILSRLYNIGSFLQYNELVHCDIGINTILICPEDHTIALTGGWWYSYKEGDRLHSMPSATYNILPRSIVEDKKACYEMMGEQIHSLGRQLLGNRHGSFSELSKTNKNFAEWLTNAGQSDIIKEYQTWDKQILASIFGARKFVKWDLKKEDVFSL
jgi:hypothetical protein